MLSVTTLFVEVTEQEFTNLLEIVIPGMPTIRAHIEGSLGFVSNLLTSLETNLVKSSRVEVDVN